MKIVIKLDPKSIDDAVKKLKEYGERLKEAEDIICRRLAEEAAAEAQNHFDGDVAVTAFDHGVRAEGPSVVFQEFGAGARISDPYPGGAEVGFEIRRGAYSDLNGGEYAQSGYESWHYDGEEYRYVTPGNGLFYGMMTALDRAGEIAREVLRDD